MFTRPDLKYARLRRESITVYCPGEGPELPRRHCGVESEVGPPTSRRNSRLLSSTSSYPPASPVSTDPPGSPTSCPDSLFDSPAPVLPTRLRLNVSGTIVETYPSTLARFPQSILGDPVKRLRLWDEEREEFYLDRHVPSFEAIFQFYQTGLLHRPMLVPLFTFVEELRYYEFGKHIVDSYLSKEGFLIDKEPVLPDHPIKKKLWLLLEHPRSSPFAKAFAIISIAIICVSTTSLCAETMPYFQHYHCHNTSQTDPVSGEVSWHEVPNLTNIFFLIESACVAWFTLELVVRFICCPQFRPFMYNKLNQVDFITVVPYALVLTVILVTKSCYIARRSASLLIFRMLRIFRIFKLTKHFRALQIFVLSLRYSIRELRLFLFLLSLACVIMAVAIYVMEVDHPDTMIESIPEGIWWAVATMTTVGYGDVYPVSLPGKLVAVVCFIAGLLVIALPTPPIVSNFNHFYRVETGRGCDKEDNM